MGSVSEKIPPSALLVVFFSGAFESTFRACSWEGWVAGAHLASRFLLRIVLFRCSSHTYVFFPAYRSSYRRLKYWEGQVRLAAVYFAFYSPVFVNNMAWPLWMDAITGAWKFARHSIFGETNHACQ